MSYYWGMDAWRAVAVLLVFSVHYMSLFYPGSELSSYGAFFRQLGHGGVDLFFVLSGFLLYAVFLKKPHQKRSTYLFSRAKRIFPAYWVALSAYAVLFALGMSDKAPDGVSEWISEGWKNVFLVSPVFGEDPWMVVSWTLTFEWGWYLALPLIFSCGFHQLSPGIRQSVLCAAWLITGVCFGAGGGPEQISLFFAGAILAEFKDRCENQATLIRGFAAVMLLCSGVVMYSHALWCSILLSGAGWALCLSLAIRPAGEIKRCWTAFVSLGKISYSFYLWHGLALHATLVVTGHTGIWWVSLPLSFSIATMVSYASYQWVEQPALHYGKKKFLPLTMKMRLEQLSKAK